MPDRRRRHCLCCGKSDAEVGAISWNGNCVKCAVALEEENNLGIAEGKGPAARRRIRGLERYIEEQKQRLAAKAV